MFEKSYDTYPFNFSYKIPEEVEDKAYIILIQAISDGEVIDNLLSMVRVPKQDINITLMLDKRFYTPGETATLTIINNGPTPITFGLMYEIYRWNGSTWILDETLTPDFWPLVAYITEPGKKWSQSISLEGASPGKYKVVKTVEAMGTEISKTLEVIFYII